MSPITSNGVATKVPALFQPRVIGLNQLKHGVVLAPLTRLRSTKDGLPIVSLMKEHYSQRSRVPGTLLISETATIAEEAGGFDHIPGIYSDEQVAAWKEIVDAVHANKSFIYLQLSAFGRFAYRQILEPKGHQYLAPSPIPISSRPNDIPKEMTEQDIKRFVQLYVTAAKRGIDEAGFDGVEFHCANGTLANQFLHEVSNSRTDSYGGSIEARSKFGLEVIDALVVAVGAERTSVRLSPWATTQDMGIENPMPQYIHFVSSLAASQPNLAYIHLTEPRVSGADYVETSESASNDPLRKIWAPRPLISCGRYTRELAIEVAETKGDLIAFGRHFIANPDLPYRLEKDIALTPYDASTFYVYESAKGYIDYPFSEQFERDSL